MKINTIRKSIEGMSDEEAKEHLLYIIESMLGSRDEVLSNQLKKNLTPALARIYTALKKAGQEGVSYEVLQVTAGNPTEGGVTPNCLKAQVSHLRRALPANETIRSVWGWGFILNDAEDQPAYRNPRQRTG